LEFGQAAENSGLDRIALSEKSELLIPIRMQSQETFHTNIVDNFLSFPMHPCTTYLVKPNQNYHNWKTARKHEFQQKLEIDLKSEWDKNWIRIELQEQVGQKRSMGPDCFWLSWISKWQVFQFRVADFGRNMFWTDYDFRSPNWLKLEQIQGEQSTRKL
jgi:hypothetical protein